MALAEEYQRQYAWRRWPRIFNALPALAGARVLDLGCGPGDLSAALCERGATVIGVDLNEELLAVARARALSRARFLSADLCRPLALDDQVDGVWCSFTAAYFPVLTPALLNWTRTLRTGGWLALVEIDDLFGHRPLSTEVQERFEHFTSEALAAGRYDFHMGRKLERFAAQAGFRVLEHFAVADDELAFDGPARPEVLDAWSQRLDRLVRLREACGPAFTAVRLEFLGALARGDHRSVASVRVCIAFKV